MPKELRFVGSSDDPLPHPEGIKSRGRYAQYSVNGGSYPIHKDPCYKGGGAIRASCYNPELISGLHVWNDPPIIAAIYKKRLLFPENLPFPIGNTAAPHITQHVVHANALSGI